MLPAAALGMTFIDLALPCGSLLVAGGLWLSITAGFVAFRTSDFFVWNDSPAVMIRAEDGGWADVNEHVQLLRQQLSERPHSNCCGAWCGAAFQPKRALTNSSPAAACIAEAAIPLPGSLRLDGRVFVPSTCLQTKFAELLMRDAYPTRWHLAIWGSAYATFAICFYCVAKRFVRLPVTAVLAVVLLLGSPPCIAASWVVVAGFQILVPLCICVSLLLYWHAIEATSGRSWATGALCVMMLLGSWVREFVGIVPILIGCLELFRARRPTLLMGIAAIFFAHAVFPTALVKFLFFPDLPLLPVSRLGHLGSRMSDAGLKWFAGWHFIPCSTPTLLVLAGISAFISRKSDNGCDRARWQRILQHNLCWSCPICGRRYWPSVWYGRFRCSPSCCA